MVEYKKQEFWKCTYCNKEYDKWEDAVECATECADIDYPEEDYRYLNICEYCKKEFEDEEDAEKCEEEHKEKQDKFYNLIALKRASEHPTQTKLMEVARHSSQS